MKVHFKKVFSNVVVNFPPTFSGTVKQTESIIRNGRQQFVSCVKTSNNKVNMENLILIFSGNSDI